MRIDSSWLLWPLIALALYAAGCGSAPPRDGKRYELKGTVVSVDKAQRTLTISHEQVKDFMDAMTMPFEVKDPWPLDVAKPGDGVNATLVVADGSAWLEDVVLTQKGQPQAGQAEPGGTTQPKAGDELPDSRLVNQDGKAVRFSQYRGKALLLTFIYTRCPLPEYCTLMSNNFAAIDQELRKDAAVYDKTHLLSVSFDPQYDTPKVLRSYGAAHTGKFDKETFAHWEFVTGEPGEVRKLAQFFGLTYVQEKDQIVHSLQTALVGPDGKIVKLYRGNEWKPEEVLSDIRHLFQQQKPN